MFTINLDKRIPPKYLRDSVEESEQRFEQALNAWRTTPHDEYIPNSLAGLINAHHAEVCEIQAQHIAQWLDSYERYEDADIYECEQ